jgi:hypothetical protein
VHRRWAAAGLLCVLFAGTAGAQQPSVQAFLEAIYKPYLVKNSPGQNYREADRLFAPDLAKAMNIDNAAAAKRGEVPILDGDPFVCAQEWDISKLAISASTTGTKTTGNVTFDTFGKPRQVTIDLVLTPTGWRIANVVCSSDPTSLRALYKLP